MKFWLHSTCDRDLCVCLSCVWAKHLYNNYSKLFLQGQQNCMPTGLWWTSEKPTISLLWTASSSIMRAPEEVRKSVWNYFQLCIYLIGKMEQCIHRFHLNLLEFCREGVMTCSLPMAFDATLLAVSELRNSSFPFRALYSIL